MGTKTGTTGNDTLYAGPDGDSVTGLGGNDWVIGAAGNDTLDGGSGQDTARGGTGDDLIHGGLGDDSINAGWGGYADTTPGAGNDMIFGDGGADWIEGGTGDDTMDAGTGNDHVSSYAGRDVLIGGAGDDSLLASLGAISVDGGGDADLIHINPLPKGETRLLQSVTGGDGDDIIGSSSLIGLRFTVDGGAGEDWLRLGNLSGDPTTQRYTVYLGDAPAEGAVIVARGIEHLDLWMESGEVYGTAAAETITGGYLDDLLVGGAGNDRLYGALDETPPELEHDAQRGGNDTLMAGLGDDTVIDFIGRNYIRGEDGNDVIWGGRDFDDLHGNQGEDTLHGGRGDDWVVGGQGRDMLFGDACGDVVYGNLGDDTVEGGAGDDIVRGGQGDDIARGGDGNDFVSGDLGTDTLTGGAGADVFHAWNGSGFDRVTDFSVAEGDRVQLLGGTFYSVSQQGADTVIDLGAGQALVLANVQLSSLPAGWIFGA